MPTTMDKIHNLLVPITGAERIGFIDTSRESLYSKHVQLERIINLPEQWNELTLFSLCRRHSLQSHILEVS